MTKGSSGAISPESADILAEAKKGKTRKFVMVCKGVNILSMVAFKRGALQAYVKEARQDVSGQVYFGVVEGGGENLSFKLARVDGFDKAPVKTTVLKDFLKSEADLNCKPLIEIVDVPPLALDEDHPLVQRFQKLQPKAELFAESNLGMAAAVNQVCVLIGQLLNENKEDEAEKSIVRLESMLTQPQTTTTSELPRDEKRDEALRLRFEEIKPIVLSHKNSESPTAKLLVQRVVEAGGFAKKHDYLQANALLDIAFELEGKLQEQKKLFDRLQLMSVDLKAALARKDESGQKLQALVTAIRSTVANNDFPQATKLLDELALILTNVVGSVSAKQFLGLLRQVERQYAQVQEAGVPNLDLLTQQLEAARTAGEQQAYGNGVQLLNALLLALNQARQVANLALPVVAPVDDETLNRLAQDWNEVRITMASGLRKLEEELYKACERVTADPRSDYLYDLSEVKGRAKRIHAVIEPLDERLSQRLFAAVPVTDANARLQIQREAVDIIDEYLAHYATSSLMAAIQTSGLPSAGVGRQAYDKLQEIARSIAV